MLALLAAESTGAITCFGVFIICVIGISAGNNITTFTPTNAAVYTTQELVQFPFFHFLFGNLGETDFFQLFHNFNTSVNFYR